MKKILLLILFTYSIIFSFLSGQIKAAFLILLLFPGYLFFSTLIKTKRYSNPYPLYFIFSIFLGLTIITHIKHLVIQPYRVENRSMAPLLHPGDNVLVEKISMGLIIGFYERSNSVKRLTFPWARQLQTGDIVILKNPVDRDNLIKRIHSIENNKYCVYGDNLEQSLDSRSFGCVDKDAIIGRLVFFFKTEA